MKDIIRDSTHFTGAAFKNTRKFWEDQDSKRKGTFTFSLGDDLPVADQYQTFAASLSAEANTILQNLGKGNKGAVFSCLLTAVTLVLERYTEEEYLQVDTPLLATLQEETYQENVPVVLGTRFTSNTIRELLNATNRQLKESYEHQNYPLQLIKSNKSRVLHSTVALQMEGIHKEWSDSDKYFLLLNSKADSDTLKLDIKYHASHFTENQVANLFAHLEHTILAFREPDTSVSNIKMLTREEINRNTAASETVSDQEASLLRRFDNLAAEQPESILLDLGGNKITYSQARKQAENLAGYLQKHHQPAPGQVVGILLDDPQHFIISVLGILKAGGTYLPIDTKLPAERIDYMLETAEAAVLITDSVRMFRETSYSNAIIALDIQLEDMNDQYTVVERKPDNAAYLIFTSGSTGKPKGVLVSERSLAGLCKWHISTFGLDVQSRSTMYASVSFDASVWEIWPTLVSGGTLYPVPTEIKLDLPALAAFLQNNKITHTFIPTALCEKMIDFPGLTFGRDLTVLTGGEKLVLSNEPPFRLVNNYGLTECTVVSTSLELSGKDNQGGANIGKPIANNHIRILDSHGRIVPDGVYGEIWIGGNAVALEYIKDPEATRARFSDTIAGNGERFYNSGDYGKWNEDGTIRFLGRKDTQVKINGNRIELGEIEQVLSAHPSVSETAVFQNAEQGRNGALIAAITPPREYLVLKNSLAEDPGAKDLYHLPNGLQIAAINKSETEFIYDEIFHARIYLNHGITIEKEDVIVDVGANIGLFSLHMGLNFPDARVFAFEPLKPIYNVLHENCTRYNLNVTTFNMGLSETEAELEFTYYPFLSAISGAYGDGETERDTVRRYLQNQNKQENLHFNDQQLDAIVEERLVSEKLKARVTTLSQVINQEGIKKIGLLKVDVEKSELDVLLGIADADWKKIRQVVLEVHALGDNLQKTEELLRKHGFQVNTIQEDILDDTGIYNVYAIKNSAADQVNPDQSVIENITKYTDAAQWKEEIAEYLREKLPAYMVPATLLGVADIPLSNSGKTDIAKLQEIFNSRNNTDEEEVIPGSTEEALLLEAWKEVLQTNRIKTSDSFFSIGGDSIKAIQICALIQEKGYKIEVKDIFRSLTIKELATLMEVSENQADQSPVMGNFRLSPIQEYFFAHYHNARNHFNQAVMINLEAGTGTDRVQAAVEKIINHHDVLRTTFPIIGGKIKAQIEEQTRADVEAYTVQTEEELTAVASQVQEGFNIATGPLFKAAVITLEKQDKLLLVAHHLVVDTISWRIILKDLGDLLQNINAALPPKTHGYYTWVQELEKYAQQGEFGQEIAYWQDINSRKVQHLAPEAGTDTNHLADTNVAEFRLTEEATRLLITEAGNAYNTQINDLLLAALSIALNHTFSLNATLITMESHGRIKVLENVDINRTVGWFSATYPVHLQHFPQDLARQVKEVKEYLRNVPSEGINYNTVRYLTENSDVPDISPQISFNYLGQFDTDIENAGLVLADESFGRVMSPETERTHLLDLSGMILDHRLTMSVTYHKQQFGKDKMQEFMAAYQAALQELIKFCTAAELQEATPSDFSYSEMSEDDLDMLFE